MFQSLLAQYFLRCLQPSNCLSICHLISVSLFRGVPETPGRPLLPLSCYLASKLSHSQAVSLSSRLSFLSLSLSLCLPLSLPLYRSLSPSHPLNLTPPLSLSLSRSLSISLTQFSFCSLPSAQQLNLCSSHYICLLVTHPTSLTNLFTHSHLHSFYTFPFIVFS